ncbi:MAG: adenylate kinase [Candidatus Omnitrophota bacterium]|nr:adenylate kinase [Candidatus Omnitrophota bacterium]MDZ4242905.1 adenylate kinase [Candidatus Omnitrophota bacterium]
MRAVLLGPPGVGKGTLAGLIKDKFGLYHFSTGDILREEIKAGSPLGSEAQQYVESGKLVPDEVVTKLIDNKLAKTQDLDRGYLLDGFPRTVQQAKDLDAILTRLNQPIDSALYMEAELPVIIFRLTGRRVCRKCGAIYHIKNRPAKANGVCDQCGGELYQRSDDNEETIKTRMDVYLKSTMPIVKYYETQGKLKTLDAHKDSEYLLMSLAGMFDEKRPSHQNKVSGRS